MTDRIPDAPWIRDAEMNGMPHPETVYCPCCGERCFTIYEGSGLVFGCEKCVKERDAAEWLEQKRTEEREEHEAW